MVRLQYEDPDLVPFSDVARFMESCSVQKDAQKRKKHLEAFRLACVNRASDKVFSIYRLLLPHCDNVRGSYNLKEKKLAAVLIKATNPKPADAQSALKWREDSSGAHAGRFVATMKQYLLPYACNPTDDRSLTVGELNAKLDDLVRAEGDEKKADVLRVLMHKTTTTQMKWVLSVIMLDVKIRLGDGIIFHDFHPDAQVYYNMYSDLQRLCLELKDPTKRIPSPEVQLGCSISPQLATRCHTPEKALEMMKGRKFSVEMKFDGCRVQLHIDDDKINYFSRNAKDHAHRQTILDAAVRAQVKCHKCILDGEILVWNKTKKYFEPFGGLNTACIAAAEGRAQTEVIEMKSFDGGVGRADSEYEAPTVGDIEIVCVVFDMIMRSGVSVIHQTLEERLKLLRSSVEDAPAEGFPVGPTMRGRLVVMEPGVVQLGSTYFSKIGESLADIQDLYDRAVMNQEEGIVVKALDSPWSVNDRSGSWLKIKPDYVEHADIDAVIIGGLLGTKRHGGLVSEYLLGLAEEPHTPGAPPTVFWSFCRVGTGVTDAERELLRELLKDNLIRADKGVPPPPCYRISGTTKEAPHYWVKDPLKSVVLKIKADVRMIQSKVFRTPYSLRFPRIDALRTDKRVEDVMTVEDLERLVNDCKGTTALGAGDQEGHRGKKKRRPALPLGAKPKAVRQAVPQHFMPTDLSGVEAETDVLSQQPVSFLNVGRHSKAELEQLVARLGGEVHQNPAWQGEHVTRHVLAANLQDGTARTTVQHGHFDILSIEWLLECEKAGELVAKRPAHYLFMRPVFKLQEQKDMRDCHGCPYYEDVDAQDVAALLERHMDIATVRAAKQRATTARCGSVEPEPSPAAASKKGGHTSVSVGPPEDLDQIILRVQRELLGVPGVPLSCAANLFRGCYIYILDMGGPALADKQRRLAQAALTCGGGGSGGDGGAIGSNKLAAAPLLPGASEAMRAAQRALADRQAAVLESLHLEVMLHGGSVCQLLDDCVTHIIVYDGGASMRLWPADVLAALKAAAGQQAAPTPPSPANQQAPSLAVATAGVLQAAAPSRPAATSLFAKLRAGRSATAMRITALGRGGSSAVAGSSNGGTSTALKAGDAAQRSAPAVVGETGGEPCHASAAVADGGVGGTECGTACETGTGGMAGGTTSSSVLPPGTLKRLRRLRIDLQAGRVFMVDSQWVGASLAAADHGATASSDGLGPQAASLFPPKLALPGLPSTSPPTSPPRQEEPGGGGDAFPGPVGGGAMGAASAVQSDADGGRAWLSQLPWEELGIRLEEPPNRSAGKRGRAGRGGDGADEEAFKPAGRAKRANTRAAAADAAGAPKRRGAKRAAATAATSTDDSHGNAATPPAVRRKRRAAQASASDSDATAAAAAATGPAGARGAAGGRRGRRTTRKAAVSSDGGSVGEDSVGASGGGNSDDAVVNDEDAVAPVVRKRLRATGSATKPNAPRKAERSPELEDDDAAPAVKRPAPAAANAGGTRRKALTATATAAAVRPARKPRGRVVQEDDGSGGDVAAAAAVAGSRQHDEDAQAPAVKADPAALDVRLRVALASSHFDSAAPAGFLGSCSRAVGKDEPGSLGNPPISLATAVPQPPAAAPLLPWPRPQQSGLVSALFGDDDGDDYGGSWQGAAQGDHAGGTLTAAAAPVPSAAALPSPTVHATASLQRPAVVAPSRQPVSFLSMINADLLGSDDEAGGAGAPPLRSDPPAATAAQSVLPASQPAALQATVPNPATVVHTMAEAAEQQQQQQHMPQPLASSFEQPLQAAAPKAKRSMADRIKQLMG